MVRETLIRKLPPAEHFGLVQVLDAGCVWKKVMSLVRRTPTDTLPCTIKYTTRHIKLVEEAGDKMKRSCAEIFLEEWGCSGQKQPTLADLLVLLENAELYAAAEYVAVNLLKEPPPDRPLIGPAAKVEDPIELLQTPLPTAPPNASFIFEERLDNVTHNAREIQLNNYQAVPVSSSGDSTNTTVVQEEETIPIGDIDISPKHISYRDLLAITNGFDCNPVGANNGRLLGKGAFGSVHLGIQNNQFTAVKRLMKDIMGVDKLFQNEVNSLLRVEHPNLLRMVAFSIDGPEPCLVYEYMSQGDLEERLSCKGRWEMPLPHLSRIRIAYGASKGLRHLHAQCPPLVHRDVKSANILLDKDLNPKLGDFGLVHLGASKDNNASALSITTVFGTSVYMAPEAMRGKLSVRSDVFSLGVVLLELLTGLSPFNADGKETDLFTYVSEECEDSIKPLLDCKAGNWLSNRDRDMSESLYSLAQDCLEHLEIKRPYMSSVEEKLSAILEL